MIFKQYEYIIKVAKLGSITEAAKQLYITQSALSQCISGEEEKHNIKIFDRTTKPLALTYQGELYLKEIIQITNQYENMVRMMQDLNSNHYGRLTLGLAELRAQELLPFVIPKFQKIYPNITFHIVGSFATKYEQLAEDREVDFSIISHPITSTKLKSIVLGDLVETVLSVPPNHPIAKLAQGIFNWRNRPPISLNEVKDEKFLLCLPGQGLRLTTDKLFKMYDITPNIYMQTASMEIIKLLSIAGVGFGFVNESRIGINNADTNGVFFRLDKKLPAQKVILCYHKNLYITRPLQTFIDICREAFVETNNFDS